MSDFLAAIGWPVLDRIHLFGDLAVSPHGIGIAIGFLLGARILLREGPKRGLTVEHINTMVFWALIGTIIGARLFYVIAHFSEFDGLYDMLAIWRGGISLLGGIAGAVLVNIPLMRKRGYRFFQVMDGAVIGIAFGIAVGRIGDLIIGDHLGKPTSWLLAWTYEGGTLPGPFSLEAAGRWVADLPGGFTETITRQGATLVGPDGVATAGVGVHQTALYDMILAAVLFAVLYFVLNRKPRREGVLTLTFGLWYGTMRVITDFLRIDKQFFGMTGSQWTALTVAIISVVVLTAWAIRARGRPAEDLELAPAKDPDG